MTAIIRDARGSPAHDTLGEVVEYTNVTPMPLARSSAALCSLRLTLYSLYGLGVPPWAAVPCRPLHAIWQALHLSARD